MLSNNYKVYKHENKINGKVYIGITSQNLERRWQKGSGYERTLFGNAIKKYGWDNFSHEIIAENLSKETACVMEKEMIAKYKSIDPEHGYNRSIGGTAMYCKPLYGKDNYRSSSVYRIDIKTGEKIKFDTIREAADTMGINHRGISKAALGIASTYKGYVWEYADKPYKKPFKYPTGKYPHVKQMKKVQMIEPDGEIHIFSSRKAAATYVGASAGNTITRYITGSRKDASGRRWSECL